jgi:hypothetical protein
MTTVAQLGATLLDHVRAIVAHDDHIQQQISEALESWRARGYTITDGGQTSDTDTDGNADFQIIEFATGETLWKNHGTLDDYDRVYNEHRWQHIDPIVDDVYLTAADTAPQPPATLPPGLFTDADPDTLRNWLTTHDQDT